LAFDWRGRGEKKLIEPVRILLVDDEVHDAPDDRALAGACRQSRRVLRPPVGALAQVVLCLVVPVAQAASADLADLSLEELANIEITSVSKRAEPLSDAAASVFVVTAEMIRRSGATSLPEALRLAPNLQVAQIDAAQYAISSRGFNNAIGNKLLVLIDGRTVYTPFFSGVFWDQQDVMLADVERIEVISGPGGTIWGTNAVNGVINVITKSAAQTQGALVVAAGGNLSDGVAARYGGTAGADGHFRAYAKASRAENTRTAAGAPVADGWDRQQGGFRADWSGASGEFTLQGDAYQGKSEDRGFFGPFALGGVDVSGANVLGRWTRQFSDGSNIRVQAYYDQARRDDALLYRPKTDIVDVELQYGLSLGRHKVDLGVGYRRARDDIRPGVFFGFIPQSSTQSWKNLFLQDDVRLSESVNLTVGARLENNGYTGTEILPSARLAWKPAKDSLLWAAASRAVRAPARLDRDIVLPPTPPYLIAGGPDFVSEVANVYELGYRAQPTRDVSVSATLFWNEWNRLRSGQPPPDALVQNMISGSTHGTEVWANWQATPAWRLSAGLTTLRKDLHLEPGSTDPDGPSQLGNDPNYQWSLRSALNLPYRQELDVAVRRVAALPFPAVSAYTAVDLRYGWRMSHTVELSVAAQNLFDPEHAEFGAVPGNSEVGRSVLLQLRWSP
jgi:iron complex outermembrane receptor protein